MLKLVSTRAVPPALLVFGPTLRPRRIMPWKSGDRCDNCGCGGWNVGRVTAECTACGEVRPL